METSYLQDPGQCGNVLKGFEGFLSSSKNTALYGFLLSDRLSLFSLDTNNLFHILTSCYQTTFSFCTRSFSSSFHFCWKEIAHVFSVRICDSRILRKIGSVKDALSSMWSVIYLITDQIIFIGPQYGCSEILIHWWDGWEKLTHDSGTFVTCIDRWYST